MIHKVIAVSILFPLICSCASGIKYQKPNNSSETIGPIALIVNDNRDIDKGGRNHLVIGTSWNILGGVFEERVMPGREPANIIKDLISDCLESSGYRIGDTIKQIPRLYINLNMFWYVLGRARIKMHLTLKFNDNQLWEDSLYCNRRLNEPSSGLCHKEFNKSLEWSKQMLIEMFNNDYFRNSYNKYINTNN
jgi:hypothetical protein